MKIKNLIIIVSIMIGVMTNKVFSQTISYKYSVTAFGIGFANTILYEIHTDTTVTLHISVNSKALARLLYNVDNTYETIINNTSGHPISQKKIINGTHFSNVFSDIPPGFFDDYGFFYPTQQPSHTLFSLFRVLSVQKPDSTQTFAAISCNTRWEVTVTPQTHGEYKYRGKTLQVRYYLLTFKSLDSHELLKKRYDDILDKELFWNSGVVRCAVDMNESVMYEARLISASPEVAIHLTDIILVKE